MNPDNETVSILHSNLIFSGISYAGDNLVVHGRNYVLKKEVKIPFIGEMHDIVSIRPISSRDEQYAELKQNSEEMTLYGLTSLIRKTAFNWWARSPG